MSKLRRAGKATLVVAGVTVALAWTAFGFVGVLSMLWVHDIDRAGYQLCVEPRGK